MSPVYHRLATTVDQSSSLRDRGNRGDRRGGGPCGGEDGAGKEPKKREGRRRKGAHNDAMGKARGPFLQPIKRGSIEALKGGLALRQQLQLRGEE